MINKDYIMRLIEQLNLVLSRLLFMKDTNDYELMMQEISRSYSQITGVDPDFVRNLSTESLIKFLCPGGRYESEKSMIIGRLLYEEAQVSGQASINSDEKTEKALNLLIEAYINNPELAFAKENTEIIIRNFPVLLAAVNTRLRLSRYFEISGQYSRAEDVLYSLLDDGYDDVKEVIISFYIRLEKRSDEELEKGNLPRTEIKEGLEKLDS